MLRHIYMNIEFNGLEMIIGWNQPVSVWLTMASDDCVSSECLWLRNCKLVHIMWTNYSLTDTHILHCHYCGICSLKVKNEKATYLFGKNIFIQILTKICTVDSFSLTFVLMTESISPDFKLTFFGQQNFKFWFKHVSFEINFSSKSCCGCLLRLTALPMSNANLRLHCAVEIVEETKTYFSICFNITGIHNTDWYCKKTNRSGE